MLIEPKAYANVIVPPSMRRLTTWTPHYAHVLTHDLYEVLIIFIYLPQDCTIMQLPQLYPSHGAGKAFKYLRNPRPLDVVSRMQFL